MHIDNTCMFILHEIGLPSHKCLLTFFCITVSEIVYQPFLPYFICFIYFFVVGRKFGYHKTKKKYKFRKNSV